MSDETRAIWVDTDLAMGSPRGDVDDGFALAAIAADRGARLLGVSSVFGNTDARRATENARRLLDAAGRSDVPVVRGAASRGAASEASEALAALPRGAWLLALGPLTNVAAALARAPDLARRLAALSVVGGNLTSRGFLPPLWPHEFNLAIDAPAARAVFDAGAPLRLFPLDVLRAFRWGSRDLASIGRLSPLGAYLAAGSARWLRRTHRRLRRAFPPWDLVPALDALGDAGIELERRSIALTKRGLVRDLGAASGSEGAHVARRLDPDLLDRAFRGRIAAPRSGEGATT